MDEWHFEIVQGAYRNGHVSYWPEWSRTLDTKITLTVESVQRLAEGPHVGRAMDIEGSWATQYHQGDFRLSGVWPFTQKIGAYLNREPLWVRGLPEAVEHLLPRLDEIVPDEWDVGLTRTYTCPVKQIVSLETWPQPVGAHKTTCRLFGHVTGARAVLQATYRGNLAPRLGKSTSCLHGPNNPVAEKWLRAAIRDLDPQIRENLYGRNVPR